MKIGKLGAQVILGLVAVTQVGVAEPKPVRLLDIGVLGLSSHDLFAWSTKDKRNTENGRFDLSTIFDFAEGKRIEYGGNTKNSENAPVYTVTMSLVQFYLALVKSLRDFKGMDPEQAAIQARKETVQRFLAQVKDSFERLTRMPFPTRGLNAGVTDEEQAAMRAMHDILPGQMLLFRGLSGEGQVVAVTDYRYAMTILSPQELEQPIRYFNGQYDPEYESILLPPIAQSMTGKMKTSLIASDAEFIETRTSFKQAEMLAELGRKSFRRVSFARLISELYSKAICNRMPDGSKNAWLPEEIVCDEPARSWPK